MRRLIVSLSTAAIIAVGAVAGLQAAATASTTVIPDPGDGGVVQPRPQPARTTGPTSPSPRR